MAVWVTGFYFSIGSILTNFAPCYLFSGESQSYNPKFRKA
jgi:hypothetical protein